MSLASNQEKRISPVAGDPGPVKNTHRSWWPWAAIATKEDPEQMVVLKILHRAKESFSSWTPKSGEVRSLSDPESLRSYEMVVHLNKSTSQQVRLSSALPFIMLLKCKLPMQLTKDNVHWHLNFITLYSSSMLVSYLFHNVSSTYPERLFILIMGFNLHVG